MFLPQINRARKKSCGPGQKFSDIEFLVITAYGTIDLAVDAIKKGAFDFLTKPFPMEELQIKIKKILNHYKQKMQLNHLSDGEFLKVLF